MLCRGAMRTTSLSTLLLSSILLAGCGGGSGSGSAGAGGHGATLSTGVGGSGGEQGSAGTGFSGSGGGQGSSGQGGGEPGPLWKPLKSGTPASLRDVWGTSATDVTIVGYNGTILHFDGTTFTAQLGGEGFELEAVGGDDVGSVWAVGQDPVTHQGVILQRAGNSWSKDPTAPMISSAKFRDVFVAGPGDVYAVSDYIWHLSAGVWKSIGNPFPTASTALWVTPTATTPRLFAGGQNYFAGSIYHGVLQMDGSVSWGYQSIPSSAPISAVLGFAEDDVYAVNYDSNLHFDGQSWSAINLGSAGLSDIWGASSDDLYGVGAAGIIVHRGKGTPGVEASGVTSYLNGVWGDGAGTVFAVGGDGTVLRREP